MWYILQWNIVQLTKEEIQSHGTIQVNLQDIILTEISQSQKRQML
jgi:hypothetical protein